MKFLKKIKSMLFSRMIIVGVLIALQFAILLLFVLRLSEYFAAMYGVLLLLSMLVMLYVVNKDQNPSYKLAWSIPILIFPLFGGLFYLLLGNSRVDKKQGKLMRKVKAAIAPHITPNVETAQRLEAVNSEAARQSQYISRAGYGAYENTQTIFHPSGESKFEAMKQRLEEAKRYILLEYFIIEEGVMWDAILEILERKAKEGIEIRMLYDGFGCLSTLPDGYYKLMREKGINCIEFNPFVPVMSLIMNNRDHRKILVVDGHVGFMGGVNLADEYINAVDKHGHWKDCAIELHGDAVIALAMMFLTMWQGITGSEEDYESYKPLPEELCKLDNGFVQPYSDTPLDNELVGEMTYLNIINRAKRYVYICSPYLIIDNETVTALSLAAKSGVDVRIITPHNGDKWYVHLTTRAFYQQLIAADVKIYEYTPGFIHSKTFISDDEIATVGTINLDYRSLYLHFECGVWMYGTDAVTHMRDDFMKTLEASMLIASDSPIFKRGLIAMLIRAVLRLLAPLM